MPDAAIKERIQECLRIIGKPTKEIASALGVSISAISHWTGGATVPTLANMERLADLANVHPAWIAFGFDPSSVSGASSDSRQSKNEVLLASVRVDDVITAGLCYVPEYKYDPSEQEFRVPRSWTIPESLLINTFRADPNSTFAYELIYDVGFNLREFDYVLVDRSQKSYHNTGTYLILFQAMPVVKHLRVRASSPELVIMRQMTDSGDLVEEYGFNPDDLGDDFKVIGRIVGTLGRYRDFTPNMMMSSAKPAMNEAAFQRWGSR